MTVLDLQGKPIGEDDWTWAARSMWTWLTDRRCRLTLIGRGLFGAPRVAAGNFERVYRLLSACALEEKHLDPTWVRELMFKLLSDRPSRIACARVTLMNERSLRDEYEAVVDAFPRVLESWAQAMAAGRPAGEKPELPDAEPSARNRHEVLGELQQIRLELEERVASEIIRPYGA